MVSASSTIAVDYVSQNLSIMIEYRRYFVSQDKRGRFGALHDLVSRDFTPFVA